MSDPSSELPVAEPESVDSARFMSKARAVLGRLGQEVVEKLLIAYFVMRDDATPRRAKMTLAGALAYFLVPFDAVTDVLPVVGFTDDAMAITLALAAVVTSIRRRHVRLAREVMQTWGMNVKAIPADDDDAAAGDVIQGVIEER